MEPNGLDTEVSQDTVTVKVSVNRWVSPELYEELTSMPRRQRSARLLMYVQSGQLTMKAGVRVAEAEAVVPPARPARSSAKRAAKQSGGSQASEVAAPSGDGLTIPPGFAEAVSDFGNFNLGT